MSVRCPFPGEKTPLVLANSTQFGLVQPALTGLEVPARDLTGSVLSDDAPRPAAARRTERALAADRRGRRRYWSVRDLSRRLWVGRGYDLLRGLIRTSLLPATRSARSWWVDDEDAAGLVAAFSDRAGKVRAFRGLDAWLRERAYIAPLTPEAETLVRLTRTGFAWRGHVYLPKTQWTVQLLNEGGVEYRHRDGAVVAGDQPIRDVSAPVDFVSAGDERAELPEAAPAIAPAEASYVAA